MRVFLAVAHTGLVAILLHPLRGAVTVACLVAVLLPYLVGLGISKGVEREAEASIRYGADLYVSGTRLGRAVPVPLSAVEAVRAVDGVTAVVPRIVGPVVIGKDRFSAVLVGLPPEHFPPTVECVEGRLPAGGAGPNQLVVGRELARRLGLRVGSVIPPFYHSARGDRLSEVVGLFRADASLWEANLILTTFDTAAAVFDQEGVATDLLVYCRPGAETGVAREILRTVPLSPPGREGSVRPRVVGRADLEDLLPRGLLHREGIFNLLFVLAFVVAIAVLLVTSGAGLAERRREVAILKATGWQTDEVLLRSLIESFCLAVAGGSLSLVLAFAWLHWLNGYWVASVFLAGVGAAPPFPVPDRLAPLPALLAFGVAFVVVASGSLHATWRAAVAPPFEALR